MTDTVLVIPATMKVGKDFPAYLPLPGGNLKASAECTKNEIAEAIVECRELARSSRERLQDAYKEHLKDVELLAQVSAYVAKFEQWEEVRTGGEPKEVLWEVETNL